MPGCPDARMSGCPDARMPGCPDARLPGCPDARMPGCPLSRATIFRPVRVVPPVLRHRDFRLFWVGALLSAMGSQFTTVAMAWQIYQLTNSPLQVGLLGLARALPQMAVTAFGGVLADRRDRRQIMMVCQVAQFCVSGSLVLLTVS